MDHIWGKPLWLQDNLLYRDMFWQRITTRMFLLYPLVGNLLPKAGFNCFYETFVQGSTAVILLNLCAKTPAFDNTRPLCHMLIIISM
jgi:hypothetical protein